MQRLSNETWKNIFTNLQEENLEVEILWLDSTDEWCLCSEYELFEDGFKTEEEALKRLNQLQEEII